jgi:hypothetical protein
VLTDWTLHRICAVVLAGLVATALAVLPLFAGAALPCSEVAGVPDHVAVDAPDPGSAHVDGKGSTHGKGERTHVAGCCSGCVLLFDSAAAPSLERQMASRLPAPTDERGCGLVLPPAHGPPRLTA